LVWGHENEKSVNVADQYQHCEKGERHATDTEKETIVQCIKLRTA